MTAKVLQFPPTKERIDRARAKAGLPPSKNADDDLNARIDRIKSSISRINILMQELRDTAPLKDCEGKDA